ncbi:MAG: competence/damage-inducible protein A [Candidatus Omnitrophica bacterium]|nr:competence/damage-inducible protein A [Candidatus Omnitrophota bacterium]
MEAEVVAIGTELLLGFVVNSDTAFLGRVLAGLGIGCTRQVTVGDNRRRLAEAIRAALSRADLVITCGGLGPTVDDVTLETIAEVTGRRLILNREVLRRIKARFARLKIRMPKSNVRQAMIPEGAIVLPNEIGTAPGFLIKLEGGQTPWGLTPSGFRLLAALPGPPAELMPMVKERLVPLLKRRASGTIILSKTLKLTGLTESEVDAKVRDLLALTGSVTVGIYAHPAQVDLRVTAKASNSAQAKRLIQRIEGKIRRRLKRLIFGADEETLEGTVGALLKKKRLTLAAAESITGGLLQHRITEVPGSSAYFLGGVVAYANALKVSPLGVEGSLLRRHGAVSPQAAKAMAAGIRRLTGSDLGISLTGIAGPTVASAKGGLTTALGPGSTRPKPVGLVYIGFSSPERIEVHRHCFSGSRSAVKFKASQAALDLIRRYLS